MAETVLIRRAQPTWTMSALATAALLTGAAALLHIVRRIVQSKRPPRHILAAIALATTVSCGTCAALLIRVLYITLAPDVAPFGMVFNVVSDSVWIAANAAFFRLVFWFQQADR